MTTSIRKGRDEIEKQNPEIMERINKLRKERDEYTKKSNECQKQIDKLYNEIGRFDQFIGKVVVMDRSTLDEGDDIYFNYLLVKEVRRLMNGAEFFGDYISVSLSKNSDGSLIRYVNFDSDYTATYYYSDVNDIEIVSLDEYKRVIGLAKESF